jgi:hypothetical protein
VPVDLRHFAPLPSPVLAATWLARNLVVHQSNEDDKDDPWDDTDLER